MSDSNRRRALADVVAVEAWHAAFKDGRGKADLHVDVVFGVGRVGGGSSGVRFRLSLKRAELIVIIPEHEPAGVDIASVRREAPRDIIGKIDSRAKISKSAAIRLGAQGALSVTKVKGDAQAKVNLSLAASKDRTVTVMQNFKGMAVTQMGSGEGGRRWIIEPALGGTNLAGRPWDADKAPRLQLVDQRKLGSKSMAAAVRVELRCLREDLEITEIRLSNDTEWAVINRRKAATTRRVAAEAAIRTLLTEEGLVAGEMSDPFAQLTLAMTIADAV